MNPKLFNQVVDLVSHFTMMKEEEIFSRSRKKAFVDARYLIIYIARHLDIRLVYIQRFFSLKGSDVCYGTLFHACNRIEGEMKEDPQVKSLVDQILLQFDSSKVIINQ